MELADRRANTSVTINNPEHDPEERAFEIPYQISCPWEQSLFTVINLPKMPEFCPAPQLHARPCPTSFFRKFNFPMTVLLQKEQKQQISFIGIIF